MKIWLYCCSGRATSGRAVSTNAPTIGPAQVAVPPNTAKERMLTTRPKLKSPGLMMRVRWLLKTPRGRGQHGAEHEHDQS